MTAHPVFTSLVNDPQEFTAGYIMHTPEGWVPIVNERYYSRSGELEGKRERQYEPTPDATSAMETVIYQHWVYKGCPGPIA